MDEQPIAKTEYTGPGIIFKLKQIPRFVGWHVRERLYYIGMWFVKRSIGPSNLVRHAEFELRRAGLFDKDSDYDGMLGEAVLELMYVFAAHGHSGYSAHRCAELFYNVARYRTLTPITSDPNEWGDVTPEMGKPMWQNKRDSRYFSDNGGETYHNIDDCRYVYKHEGGPTWSTGTKMSDAEIAAEGKPVILLEEPKCGTCMCKDTCKDRKDGISE